MDMIKRAIYNFFFGRLLPSGVLSYNHCISSFARRYILGTNEWISLDV